MGSLSCNSWRVRVNRRRPPAKLVVSFVEALVVPDEGAHRITVRAVAKKRMEFRSTCDPSQDLGTHVFPNLTRAMPSTSSIGAAIEEGRKSFQLWRRGRCENPPERKKDSRGQSTRTRLRWYRPRRGQVCSAHNREQKHSALRQAADGKRRLYRKRSTARKG